MTREITIYSNPVAAPGVCAKCGSQNKEWFVDLGFELEMQKFDTSIDLPVWLDGVVYLCCDCINDLVATVGRRFEVFKKDHYTEVGFNGIPGNDPDPISDGAESEANDDSGESVERTSENAISVPTSFFGAA